MILLETYKTGIYLKDSNYPYKNNLTLEDKVRKLNKYIVWRKQVLDRDKNKCLLCGSVKDLFAVRLHNLRLHLKELKVTQDLQAVICSDLWDIKKGKTYCRKCFHKV